MKSPRTRDQSSRFSRLGALEKQVMDLLWEQSPLTVRDVMDALSQRPAYTTIATVMQNLQRKDLVYAQREGRSVRYLPRISREEHTANLMRHALNSSHDRAASILHFVKDMPAEELSMLRDYLDSDARQEES